MRHAKSSWDDLLLSDHDRSLKERGFNDAKRMGKVIQQELNKLDHVYCSTAKRAQQTLKQINPPSRKVSHKNELYTFNSDELIEFITQLDDHNYIMIVGHNPAFTDFVNEVSNCKLENIPTSGVVLLEWSDTNSWSNISEDIAKMLWFETPKKYKNK